LLDSAAQLGLEVPPNVTAAGFRAMQPSIHRAADARLQQYQNDTTNNILQRAGLLPSYSSVSSSQSSAAGQASQ